ncbi:MAG: aminopeptidase P family protein [Bacillota bacterium]|nr:aminopeptidase P family protein [Bacillota bacterium]
MLNQIRSRLAEINCDVFISMHQTHRRYLTKFTGSAGLVWISHDANILITDFRYTEQAGEQSPDWEIILQQSTLEEAMAQLIEERRVRRVAFESEYITVNQLAEWQEKFEAVEFVPTKGLVAQLRRVKTSDEIEKIAAAAKIAVEALTALVPRIKPGMAEAELALELEYMMRRLGAEAAAFDPIVGSGPRGALPHAIPSDRKIQAGDFIVIDMGCVYQGYCSDLTRTFVVGRPEPKQLEIYNIVLEAQTAALNVLKPGLTGREVDSAARDVIRRAGYDRNFGHSLGHGVGLEIHEDPRLSQFNEEPLAPRMVVTVEPGIYLPGWGGVRIEDLVVVTESGCDILTELTKELTIIE